MHCPDELTLELWAGDALPQHEAEAVSAHVASCATCVALHEYRRAAETRLQAALELNPEERDYLAGLDLGSAWRTQGNPLADTRWGWLALLAVCAAFAVWTFAAQPFGELLDLANQVGLGTVLLTSGIGLLLRAIQTFVDVSTAPALSLMQPLLLLVALALLLWPRITSAPRYLQGVRS
jgi:hypothetical protein